ncbi:MAG: hypothetical protein M1831_005391 [Alyxoria varia]|nr:MAG: hypothetical protein M1831_005391 [Alyxoria varia]
MASLEVVLGTAILCLVLTFTTTANSAHTDVIYNGDSSTWSCCQSNPDYEYQGWDCKANPSGEAWDGPAPVDLSTLAIIPSVTESPPIVVATSYTAGTRTHKSSATRTAESESAPKNMRPVAENSPQRTADAPPPATPMPTGSSRSGLSAGEKAGIGVGVTAGAVAILLLLAYFLFRNRLRQRFFSREKIPSVYEKSADDHGNPGSSCDASPGPSSNQHSAEEVYQYYQPRGETNTVGAYYTGPVISPKGSPPESSQQHQWSTTRGTCKYKIGPRSNNNTTSSPDGVSPPSAHPGSTIPNPSYGLTPQHPNSAPVIAPPQHSSICRLLQGPQAHQQHQAKLTGQNYLEHGPSSDNQQQNFDLQGAVMAASHPSTRSRTSTRKHSSRRRNGNRGAPHAAPVKNTIGQTQDQHFTAPAPPYSHNPKTVSLVREEQSGDRDDASLTETDDEPASEEADIPIQAPWHPANPQTEIQELPSAEKELQELPTTEMKDAIAELSAFRNSRHGEKKGGLADGKRHLMKELPKEPVKEIGSPRQPQSRSQSQQGSPGSKGYWTGSPKDKGIRKR